MPHTGALADSSPNNLCLGDQGQPPWGLVQDAATLLLHSHPAPPQPRCELPPARTSGGQAVRWTRPGAAWFRAAPKRSWPRSKCLKLHEGFFACCAPPGLFLSRLPIPSRAPQPEVDSAVPMDIDSSAQEHDEPYQGPLPLAGEQRLPNEMAGSTQEKEVHLHVHLHLHLPPHLT